jgi:hypothetical protein
MDWEKPGMYALAAEEKAAAVMAYYDRLAGSPSASEVDWPGFRAADQP